MGVLIFQENLSRGRILTQILLIILILINRISVLLLLDPCWRPTRRLLNDLLLELPPGRPVHIRRQHDLLMIWFLVERLNALVQQNLGIVLQFTQLRNQLLLSKTGRQPRVLSQAILTSLGETHTGIVVVRLVLGQFGLLRLQQVVGVIGTLAAFRIAFILVVDTVVQLCIVVLFVLAVDLADFIREFNCAPRLHVPVDFPLRLVDEVFFGAGLAGRDRRVERSQDDRAGTHVLQATVLR